jgi:hypothetical protein
MTLGDGTTVQLQHTPSEDPRTNAISAGHIHIKSNDMETVLEIEEELLKTTSYRKSEDYDGWFHTLKNEA